MDCSGISCRDRSPHQAHVGGSLAITRVLPDPHRQDDGYIREVQTSEHLLIDLLHPVSVLQKRTKCLLFSTVLSYRKTFIHADCVNYILLRFCAERSSC